MTYLGALLDSMVQYTKDIGQFALGALVLIAMVEATPLLGSVVLALLAWMVVHDATNRRKK